mmetsp:Transcript_29781/g.28950  ORF Transcript_29781/g.28950 Transcript_29781/m.28950 type:complete len:87 (+) Transcript_29781:462-722(+)
MVVPESERNKETISATLYDRTFVLNGPIIKVYKTDDQMASSTKLVKEINFPVIKNFENQQVDPNNLLLFNNESSLMFMDQSHKNVL